MSRRMNPPTEAVDDLADNIQAFVHSLRAERKSEKTIEVYRAAADDLERYLRAAGGPLAVAAIKKKDIEDYLIYLSTRITNRGRATAPSSMNQYYRSLLQFWKRLEQDETVTTSPMRNIAPPTIPDNPPPMLSDEDLKKLARACEGRTYNDRRDAAILAMFMDSGIRLAELTGLQRTDIDLEVMEATVTGKFGRTRTVRFSPQTVRSIDRYLKLRRDHPDARSDALWLGERGPMTPNGIAEMVKRRARPPLALTGITQTPHAAHPGPAARSAAQAS